METPEDAELPFWPGSSKLQPISKDVWDGSLWMLHLSPSSQTTVSTCNDWVPSPDLLVHLELLSNHEKQREAFHSQATKSWIVQPENSLQWSPGSLVSMTGSTGKRTGKSVCLHSPTLESDQARRILNAWSQHQLQNNFMDLLSMPGFTHCFCLSLCRFLTVVHWKEAACTCLMTSS